MTPEAKPAEGEKKEPWQMTAAEYEETPPMDTRIIPPQRKRQGASIVRLSEDETVTTSEHGKAVFEAIRAGKPVPAEVIAEYPELTKKEEKPAPKPSEKPTFRQFIEAKGIAWPVKTSDPRYKVLKEEYDAVKAIPPAVVETLTEESKEEKAEPAPQPEARGELAPELKSLILMDMKTALEEGHKYGMRDDETVGQGSNQVPIGTTNPPWLMDIIRAMKAKNKQTTGKTEILAVIKKELEGKGDTFSPKQLKLWFIIEDHLREESGKPHYTKAAEIMSGTMETLIDDYNEGADIGQYDDSDLEFPPTEKEIETAAVNVVSEEVANGNEAALQTYQAERGEARKEENEAPAAETGPAEEVKPKTKEPWELTSADLIKVDEKRLPRGTYRGLLLDANGEYVGDVHLVDGKVHVVDKKPYGRGEIIARLPDTYAPGLLKKSHSLRISDTQTDSYWTFRKPESEPEPKTEPTKAGTQGVIPGASEAETFMLTGAPGEVGTSAPTTGVPKTGELFAEEKAKFPEYTPAISIDAKRRLNTLAGKANLS